MHAVCKVFSTAVVMHNDRTVPRSAFGPPHDDIAVRDCMTLLCLAYRYGSPIF